MDDRAYLSAAKARRIEASDRGISWSETAATAGRRDSRVVWRTEPLDGYIPPFLASRYLYSRIDVSGLHLAASSFYTECIA